ncbi:MAG TPA: ATP/GTP-binding protein [Actinoplanes sp.]|nr:ATP/GTP-binding protein [Actinoplanes sp.]
MDSVRTEWPSAAPRVPVALKILIAGGFGAGKTTLVASVSEIRPLQTEEVLSTTPGGGAGDPHTVTVTVDFGRITLNEDLQLYLFGTPGQQRSGALWDDLALGALGAVVLVDPRRPEDCRPSIDQLRRYGTPYVVAVNRFDSAEPGIEDTVRRALAVARHVPVLRCDARDRQSARNVLIDLVEYVTRRQMTTAGVRQG